jgi:predicted ATPase with chaperone activity
MGSTNLARGGLSATLVAREVGIKSIAVPELNAWGLVGTRPFRSPHPTISDARLIEGEANLRPGEVSLGHNGVLFLDEVPEFQRTVLEVMR